MEEWRDIPGYEGIYKVSSIGRVMRCDEYKTKTYKNGSKNRIIKQNKDTSGYYIVGLNKNGKRKIIRVHKIVAIAFLNYPDNKDHVIDHINRDKTDNRVENLRRVSRSKNTRNCYRSENSTSQYNGVNKQKNRYISKTTIEGRKGKRIYLGCFESEEEAARAFDRFVIEHGLDRALNFPEEYKEVM